MENQLPTNDQPLSVTPGQFVRDFALFCAAALGVGLAVGAVAATVVVVIRSAGV